MKPKNQLATLIECSPGKNIIYEVSAMEAQLICDVLEQTRIFFGKYWDIEKVINHIKKQSFIYGADLFKDMKVTEKKIIK